MPRNQGGASQPPKPEAAPKAAKPKAAPKAAKPKVAPNVAKPKAAPKGLKRRPPPELQKINSAVNKINFAEYIATKANWDFRHIDDLNPSEFPLLEEWAIKQLVTRAKKPQNVESKDNASNSEEPKPTIESLYEYNVKYLKDMDNLHKIWEDEHIPGGEMKIIVRSEYLPSGFDIKTLSHLHKFMTKEKPISFSAVQGSDNVISGPSITRPGSQSKLQVYTAPDLQVPESNISRAASQTNPRVYVSPEPPVPGILAYQHAEFTSGPPSDSQPKTIAKRPRQSDEQDSGSGSSSRPAKKRPTSSAVTHRTNLSSLDATANTPTAQISGPPSPTRPKSQSRPERLASENSTASVAQFTLPRRGKHSLTEADNDDNKRHNSGVPERKETRAQSGASTVMADESKDRQVICYFAHLGCVSSIVPSAWSRHCRLHVLTEFFWCKLCQNQGAAKILAVARKSNLTTHLETIHGIPKKSAASEKAAEESFQKTKRKPPTNIPCHCHKRNHAHFDDALTCYFELQETNPSSEKPKGLDKMTEYLQDAEFLDSKGNIITHTEMHERLAWPTAINLVEEK